MSSRAEGSGWRGQWRGKGITAAGGCVVSVWGEMGVRRARLPRRVCTADALLRGEDGLHPRHSYALQSRTGAKDEGEDGTARRGAAACSALVMGIDRVVVVQWCKTDWRAGERAWCSCTRLRASMASCFMRRCHTRSAPTRAMGSVLGPQGLRGDVAYLLAKESILAE
jgi:hypothetical protein